MPWTAKWIAAIVGTFVLLVIADRIWYVQEMKALAAKLGVEWSKIERRGTFPYEYYKKVVHYGMTKDEVRKIMAHYARVEEKQYGNHVTEYASDPKSADTSPGLDCFGRDVLGRHPGSQR